MRGFGGVGFVITIFILALVGFAGYQIGVTQQLPPGQAVAPVGYPYYWHPFGFFGFFGLLFPLLFLLFIFGAMRAAFGGGWRGRYGHSHGWHHDGPPSAFEDWHRQAHGDAAPSDDRTSTPPPSGR